MQTVGYAAGTARRLLLLDSGIEVLP